MRPTMLLFVTLMLVFPARQPSADVDDSRRLRGEYTSDHHRGKRPLEATFALTQDDHWKVVFHFDWDRRRTYSGTAEGSLSEGPLEGVVADEGRRRIFTFRGEFKDGLFEGTHYEVDRRGRERRTGTLVLRR